MYRKKAHIHFVGIGGIGMSGIATILRQQGYTISGCDLDVNQKSAQLLKEIGCTLHEGNNTPACNDPSIEILVYSSAIRAHNEEILTAQRRGIPTIPRALMLAELMRTKYSIAIAGAHGKTTTTSLVSHILIEAGLKPTVIIGGHLKNISTNARFGDGEFLVAEADESDRSLLHLHATLAIVTNIDLEHLDVYKDLDDIKQTFLQFLNNLPFYGKAILCTDDANIRSLLPLSHLKIIKYGIDNPADIMARDVILAADHSRFTLVKHDAAMGEIHINLPGRHNVLNALAAIALAQDLNIPLEIIQHALAGFKGIDRRFSYHGIYRGAEIFDDYGHHPTEIDVTLKVARNRSRGRVVVVFQPHRYTRTKALWDQFIEIFLNSPIDDLLITDIYAASEDAIPGITSIAFVEALKERNPKFSVTYVPYEYDFTQIRSSLDQCILTDDLVLLLGAGRINQLAQYIISP
jgi:UDP-N-acetylmuramate--alanine ligase